MPGAILPQSDRVTASIPRGDASPHTLVLQFPGGSLPLQSAVSIGADGSNQVVLEDRFVSRFHCRLLPSGGRWLLKDLDSTNGTYLDGARVAEAEIDEGARIRVGSHADVARLLAPAGEDGLSHLQLGGVGADRDVALATGAAGTVYLCHPFLIHAAQVHRGKSPRVISQPPLAPAEPFGLERADGTYSPVEIAIRSALQSE